MGHQKILSIDLSVFFMTKQEMGGFTLVSGFWLLFLS